jgi:hypothetical protein
LFPCDGKRGFTDGDCLSLGQRTGDGKFDGKTFWVGCGWIFSWGVRGRGRGTQGYILMRSFRRTTRVPNNSFYVIYYILISGGFDSACVRLSRRYPLILDSLVSHGLHGTVGMVSYSHVVYVTSYFCYMFSLGPSSESIGSVRIYRSVWRTIYT